MKYIAEDGQIFKTPGGCIAYEEKLALKAGVSERVKKYLSLREYKNDGARRRALTIIMGWIEYDILSEPERYGLPTGEEVEEAEVVPIAEEASA